MVHQALTLIVAAAAVAAAGPASAQHANSRSQDRAANDCLSMLRSVHGDAFVSNRCPFPVNFGFCWSKPHPNSPGAQYRCQTLAFGSASVDAQRRVRVAPSNRGTLHLAACPSPQSPAGMRFEFWGSSHQCQ